MEDKAYTYVFYDILEKVLKLSDNPRKFAEFLASQIRELIGARIIIITTKSQTEKPIIFSVFPERRREWAEQKSINCLIEISYNFNVVEYIDKDKASEDLKKCLCDIQIDKLIVLPLIAGNERIGSILLIDIMDMFGINSIIDMLKKLSGVFALIIRNSILYYNMENLVEQKTKELQKRNTELLAQEKQLKVAIEEYEAINEELNESIAQAEEINDQLEKAKAKAEESDRLKSSFLQNMSHEIRTPMNAICGFSDMLTIPNLSEEKRSDYVSIINRSAQQLLSIINDILTISAVETKQEKVYIEDVCINEVIFDLLEIFSIQTNKKNIHLFENHALSNTQSYIATDRTKLNQILTNLLTNALKFTESGGSITFGYEVKNKELLFFVKDTGIGISEEAQQYIFDRFIQADTSISVTYGGTGLGLAISKAFVEMLGGKIWVVSENGKGSMFCFTLPYNPVNSPINDFNIEKKLLMK